MRIISEPHSNFPSYNIPNLMYCNIVSWTVCFCDITIFVHFWLLLMLQLFLSASDAKDSNDDAAYMPSTKMVFKSARILLASTHTVVLVTDEHCKNMPNMYVVGCCPLFTFIYFLKFVRCDHFHKCKNSIEIIIIIELYCSWCGPCILRSSYQFVSTYLCLYICWSSLIKNSY